MKKIKVIYIAGFGRSGTTLLDRLLGQVDPFFSAGELIFIWESFLEKQLCGCGSKLEECEIWKDVANNIFGSVSPEEKYLKKAIELRTSLTNFKNFHNSLIMKKKYNEDVRRYICDYLSPLYSSIKGKLENNIIVDSSKNSLYMHILSKCEFVDLYVIHMIRDSRAVAYSWKKRKDRPDIPGKKLLIRRMNLINSSARWMTVNHIVYNIKQSLPKNRYYMLKYEDMMKNPRCSLENILEFLNIKAKLSFFLNDSTAVLSANHTVSGNPMRFKKGVIDVRYDDEWENEMKLWQRYIVNFITYPLLSDIYKK